MKVILCRISWIVSLFHRSRIRRNRSPHALESECQQARTMLENSWTISFNTTSMFLLWSCPVTANYFMCQFPKKFSRMLWHVLVIQHWIGWAGNTNYVQQLVVDNNIESYLLFSCICHLIVIHNLVIYVGIIF